MISVSACKPSTTQHPQPRRPMHLFVKTQDQIVSKSSDRLVITIATGAKAAELIKITGPLMRSYAARSDADFALLYDTTQTWWGLEKFRVLEFAKQYEQTLFVDADCLIRPDAANVFERYPGVAMFNDWPHMLSHPFGAVDQYVDEWSTLMKSQGVSDPYIVGRFMNSGVVLCDRDHADIWTPTTRPMPGQHCDEQMWIDRNSGLLTNYAESMMARKYNHQWWVTDFADEQVLNAAEIIHLAACPWKRRIELAQRFVSNWWATCHALANGETK